MSTKKTTLAAIVAGALIAGEARAESDDRVRCMTSYEQGQRMKRDGKLSAARIELAICNQTCPAIFSRDCDRWLREVEALTPTVRFHVGDGRGGARRDVRVLVDGELVADPIPEGPVAVDPGARVFRFERARSQPVEVKVTLAPGERERRIEVTLIEPQAPPPTPPRAPNRTASYVFGGIGIGALAVAGGLLVKGHLDRRHLEDTCAPACDPAEVDPIRATWWASAATAGAGLVSLGLAYLLWPRGRASGGLAIAPTFAGLSLRGEFP